MAKMNKDVAKVLRNLKREVAKIEKSAKKTKAPKMLKDQYKFDIKVAKGNKANVKVYPLTVVTIGCPTVAGTCMGNSCYTC